MPVIINASTSAGAQIIPDNSGVLQFQSNGANTTSIAANGTLTSSNLTATGTVTAGNVTISSGGSITFPDATTQSTAATAGAWVKVATTNVTSSVATVDFTNLGSYRAIKVTLSNVLPATDGEQLWARISSDNGVTFITGNLYTSNTTDVFNGALNGLDSKWTLSGGVGNLSSDGAVGGEMTIIDFNIAQKTKLISSLVRYDQGAAGQQEIVSAGQANTTAMNALRFLFANGNVAQGLFMVEGWTGS